MKKMGFRGFLNLILVGLALSWLWGCGVAKKEITPVEPWPEAPQERVCRSVVKTALGLVGSPYRYGGEGPESFDCSGLTS